MPFLIPLLALGGGTVLGFGASSGTEKIATAVKWVAIGVAVYNAPKIIKLLK